MGIDGPYPEDIGRRVLYKSYHGEVEEGTVVAYNSAYVFVRYGGETGSKATAREQLEWIHAHDR